MDGRAGRAGEGPARRGPIAAGAWTLLALALAFEAGQGGPAGAAAITIMPLGDSITYGYSDPALIPGGYRAILYRDLVGAGYTPTFVGSQTTNPDPTLPAAAQAHEGHVGWLIAGDGGFASFSLAGNINKWLAPGNGVNPNLILLEIGSNEIVGNYHQAAAPYELAALVTRILELRPNAEVLLSTIPPQNLPGKESQVVAFNQALSGPDGIVAQLKRRGENVDLVNAGGSVAPSELSHDGLHPLQAGYVKIANAWFQAIQSSEGANDAVKLPGPTLAPEPSTFALMGSGLLGLLAARRARARSTRRA